MHTCDNCKYIVSVSYVYTYIKITVINDEKNACVIINCRKYNQIIVSLSKFFV